MGGVSSFVKDVGKGILKGGISTVGAMVPIIGGPLASAINSRFAIGGDVGSTSHVPDGVKTKTISTVGQLESLVKKYPEIAKKHGLSVEKIQEHVEDAKKEKTEAKESKAIGSKDVKKVKSKKPRSEAQKKAFEKMIASRKKK